MRLTRPPAGMGRHVLWRVWRFLRPNVRITDPPTTGVVVERDVEVTVRDGTVLRVDVFRPDDGGHHPVLLCTHPYGKATNPAQAAEGRRRRRYPVPFQYRMLPQSQRLTISAWTGWEAPDPAVWVPKGYVVVNADLRGWGTSDGKGELLSHQEGQDGHDLVEWAAAQSWSSGKVGMTGVSYLALTQWATAAERPSHLAAICPWEGFTDLYRDFARPGGVREDGFIRLFTTMLKRQGRSPVDLRKQQRRRDRVDAWWEARNRDVEAIDVPVLVCGSFSDHCLHSRGSFEGFRRVGSPQRWLYTHRGPKWATYYGREAVAFQQRFFDHFLQGRSTGMVGTPRVRVEVRSDAKTVTAVHEVETWPPPGTSWTPLHLDATGGTLSLAEPSLDAAVSFDNRTGGATFTWRFGRAVEVVGPMRLRLPVQVRDADDVFLFAGVRKLRRGKEVGFEGSYGWTRDLVTHGMLKASMRAVDPEQSLAWLPHHPFDRHEPLHALEVAAVDVELLASATHFEKGSELRLEVQGRWFFPTNPLTGQLPARYERSPEGTTVLHTGPRHEAVLLVPTTSTLS